LEVREVAGDDGSLLLAGKNGLRVRLTLLVGIFQGAFVRIIYISSFSIIRTLNAYKSIIVSGERTTAG
jgi:hypothetical protein